MTSLTTRELRARVEARFTRQSSADGYTAFRVLREVPVDTLETTAERLNRWRAKKGLGPVEDDGEDPDEWRARWLARPAGTRRIDVVAVGCWRSTGYAVHGIELKVSRSDWLKELRTPDKAASAARFCDFWWLAVGDAAIVDRSELPAGWGLLVPHGRHLRQAVKPAQLDRVHDPKFTAALVAVSASQHHSCQGLGYLRGWQAGWEGRSARYL